MANGNAKMLGKLVVATLAMFGFGFALVPFYYKICEVPGINAGDEQALVRNTQVDPSRSVTIEFDANVNEALPWRFRPEVRTMTVHPGQLVQGEYVVTNNGAAQCITFRVTTVSGACTGGVHLTAYSGAFVPANVATGYLGDSGSSATSGNPQTLSVDLSAGQTIRLVASNGASGASDCPYTGPAPAGVLGTGGAGAVAQVPTLGEWGLMLLGLLAAGFGARRLPR